MKNIIVNEPVVVTTLVEAVIVAAVLFGVDISTEQKAAIIGVVSAALMFVARSLVTPTANPKVPADTVVRRLPAK